MQALMRPAADGDASSFGRSRRERSMTRRWGAAFTMSLALHGAVAGANWAWRDAWELYPIAPQSGRASIALTVSMAAMPEPSLPEVAISAHDEAFPAGAEKRHETTAAVIVRSDSEALEPVLRWLAPVEPVIVVMDEAATPVMVGGTATRNTASRETPPPVAESASSRPTRKVFEPEASTPSPASIPSPASLASRGVESDNPPQAVVNPAPIYPPDALAAGRTGRVIVRANVAADGGVIGVRVRQTSGVASLDRAAEAAVRRWRFSPAADGDAPSRRVDVPFDFVIRRTAAASSAGR
jgi:protein TonB